MVPLKLLLHRVRRVGYRLKLAWLFLYTAGLRIFLRGNYIVLLGTPVHGNLGDQAIALAEHRLFADACPGTRVLELNALLMRQHCRLFRFCIGHNTIYIHGGGFIGTIWPIEESMLRSLILAYPNNRIVILPQTAYFDSSPEGKATLRESEKIYNAHPDLWICAREKTSLALCRRHFPKAHSLLVPDIVTYLDGFAMNAARRGVLLCLRGDKEKVLSGQALAQIQGEIARQCGDVPIRSTDTVLPCDVPKKWREGCIREKLEEFAAASLVVTDRLHGMVFAAFTGTPCVALSSLNHKVRGVYEWISENPYIAYIESIADFGPALARVKDMHPCVYRNTQAKEGMRPLLELVRESHRK